MRTLTPVPFTHVRLTDPFWAPRMATNQRVTIPLAFEHCRRTNRLKAFDPAWRRKDKTARHKFWDSDVAKLIEAAADLVATTPDRRMRRLLDEAVRGIVKAQQPDGYLNSYYAFAEPELRFKNLRDNHELYCAGHLIEAAVAYFQATGERAFLDAMDRYADLLAKTFGRKPGQKRGYCGHQEIELALVILYRATGKKSHLELAKYFLDERGRAPHYYDKEAQERGDDPKIWYFKSYDYLQAHLPVREQQDAVGHAVRCLYMLTAMADVAMETSDASMRAACERLWRSMYTKRMLVTGGVGTWGYNEGFSYDYDLPDESAYAETCAAIASVFFNQRMLSMTGDSKYADILERALYNGALSGVSLDGNLFFYSNPLAVHDPRPAHQRDSTETWDGLTPHRKGWFGCACCPPNIARLLASMGDYMYGVSPAGVYVHLYAQSSATLVVKNTPVTIAPRTKYPWDGAIHLTVQPERPTRFTVFLRMPAWCDEATVRVCGEDVQLSRDLRTRRGYIALTREWRRGDTIDLELAMPVRRVYAHPAARQLAGRVALQRGPLVYCLESVDNPGVVLEQVTLARRTPLTVTYKPNLLGGVCVITGRATTAPPTGADLYRATPPKPAPVTFTAVPYCVWDNRAPGSMRVWLRDAER
jgi:DUF1680 family protein